MQDVATAHAPRSALTGGDLSGLLQRDSESYQRLPTFPARLPLSPQQRAESVSDPFVQELWGQGFACRFSPLSLCHGVTSSPRLSHDILRHPLPDHRLAPPSRASGVAADSTRSRALGISEDPRYSRSHGTTTSPRVPRRGFPRDLAPQRAQADLPMRCGSPSVPHPLTAWLGRYESAERLRPIAALLRLGSTGYVSNLISRCERASSRMTGFSVISPIAASHCSSRGRRNPLPSGPSRSGRCSRCQTSSATHPARRRSEATRQVAPNHPDLHDFRAELRLDCSLIASEARLRWPDHRFQPIETTSLDPDHGLYVRFPLRPVEISDGRTDERRRDPIPCALFLSRCDKQTRNPRIFGHLEEQARDEGVTPTPTFSCYRFRSCVCQVLQN